MKHLLVLCLLGTAAIAAEKPQGIPENYKLLYEQTFDKPEAAQDFVFSDPKAWRMASEEKGHSLELFEKSKYQPKHRSPFNIALIADKAFGDYVLDVELQSTVKPYGHQDMCVFHGFESTNKFYYTHIAVAADPHAHNTFIVNDAPRKAIAKETTKGVIWKSEQWHKVRIERKLSEGTIKVYFDDLAKPIMVTEDKTCGVGFIGFGSFDDKGKIDNIRIYGPSVENRKADFFQKLKH